MGVGRAASPGRLEPATLAMQMALPRTATAIPRGAGVCQVGPGSVLSAQLRPSRLIWVPGCSVTSLLGLSLAGEGPGCTWKMTEKANGVKSSLANNHNHHAPPAIKVNGEDDHRTSNRWVC